MNRRRSDGPKVCYRVFVMPPRVRRKWLAVPAFAAAIACAAPTLPLPPPAVPDVSTAGLPAGKVKLASVHGSEPNALIVTYNRNPGLPLDQRVGGAQADGSGTWDAIISATTGDVIDVTEEIGTTRSAPTTLQIPCRPSRPSPVSDDP